MIITLISNVSFLDIGMSSVLKVPPGWVRKKVGKKVVYITEVPRVHIWKIGEFDRLQKQGRFPTVSRDILNFSIKVRNLLVLGF